MSLITLTTDYGYTDYRVAAIKGRILSLSPEARIVDISHEIQAYNLQQTAYTVGNAYHFFPKGSIHVISVDSFFHKDRKCVIYKADDHYFIAADNGVLSLIFADIQPDAVYEITYNTRFDDVVNFTTLDVFAPAAVHLQNGGLPEVIGRRYLTPRELSLPKSGTTDNLIFGEVLYIDNFGSIISNISKTFFEENIKGYEGFTIKFRNLALSRIYKSYTDIVTDWNLETEYHGKPVAIFNSAGLLELTIYKGNITNGAKTLFGLKVGERIYVEFHRE